MPPSVPRLRARATPAGSPDQLRELRALVPPPASTRPRVLPGTRHDIGAVNWAIATIAGRVAGTKPLNVITTIARDRGLFRSWLLFAGRLMPGGRLPRVDTELVILRVAYNCRSSYEWHQHVPLALGAGLSVEQVAAVPDGASAGGPWTARQATLLRVVDELHADRTLSDDTWSSLTEHVDQREVIELLMLTGHYEMLAMALNSMGVQIESPH